MGAFQKDMLYSEWKLEECFLCVAEPTVGKIAWSLLPLQQSHISCHSSKQNLSTQGISLLAGNFIFAIGDLSTDFAAASALSLPRILM